jgi:hypothetical protein
MRFHALIVVVAASGACGGAGAQTRRDTADFDCKERMASYTTVHHMSGDEIGVQIDCAEKGPRIKRWKVDKGQRLEDGRPMSAGEFDQIWQEIEGTGWRNMFDCANGSGNKRDPIYQFDIKDETDHKQFTCQSVQMPYPYNDLVSPLDLAAQQGRSQLGDDEPADAKALDHKNKAK